MDSIVRKGDQLREEAERTLNKWSFFNREQKLEDAAELYKKAGAQYKRAERATEAADVYRKAADLFLQVNTNHEACMCLVEAAATVKRVSSLEAVGDLRRAIELYCENNRFGTAARHQKEIAEIFEQDGDQAAALEAYDQAAALYRGETHSSTQAADCLKKVAELAALQGDYSRGANIFEQLGSENLGHRTLSFNAKSYFTNAVLCLLAMQDAVAAEEKFRSFVERDHNFRGTREEQLISRLIEAVQNRDQDAFSQACADFDQISPLDAWKTSVLVVARRGIAIDDEAEEEPDLT